MQKKQIEAQTPAFNVASNAAPAVQANLQNASVQCNQQLPEDIHGIAAVRGPVQQLRREATYKSL